MFHTDEEIKNPWPDGMPIGRQIVYGLLCVLFVLGAAVLLGSVGGCSDAQVEQLLAAKNAAEKELTAKQAEIEQLKAEIAQLPEGPAKEAGSKAIAATEKVANTLGQKITQLGTLIEARKRDDAAAVGSATGALLGGIPGVGAYAGLAGTLAGIVYGELQRRRKTAALEVAADAADLAAENQKHLKNVVFSMEHGGPEWTPEHASEIAALQGPETTAAVNAIKSEIGIAYAHPVENTTAAN